MKRITVNVDDDTEEWLEEEKDRLGMSKAELGGICINQMYSTVQHINPHQNDVPYSDVQQSDSLAERLGELEERVASLESRGEVVSEETTVEETSLYDPNLRSLVDDSEWTDALKKTDARVDAVAYALTLLRDLEWATNLTLRHRVSSDMDEDYLETSESSLQRILSDVLGDLDEVDEDKNHFHWVGE